MKNNKKIIIICTISIVVLAIIGVVACLNKDKINKFFNKETKETVEQASTNTKEETIGVEVKNIDDKVDIVDMNSNSRPYAFAVNNTAVAVKVQEGLNKAYMVYEIPTEGNTSRLLAFYKDIDEDLIVGTIRSARHNFVDFALESDAIFCCFGWSHYAEDDMKKESIDYLQGLFGYPYYRENPERLATEHTAYTSMAKIKDATSSKGFRTTSEDSILLNYFTDDVDLSSASNVKQANKVTIPYGAAPQIASFIYDEASKMYIRYEDGNKCLDYRTKEEVATKNIIVQKITYQICSDKYYWDLNTVSRGEGYFITNGQAIPITWSKSNRNAKTKYCYANGTTLNGEDVSRTGDSSE